MIYSQLSLLMEQKNSNSFNAYSKKIDKSGNFYHITQQGYNYGSIFSPSTAKYRQHMMIKFCQDNGVLPLCNVIMPNHTHDLFYSEKFENISKILKILNSAVTRYAHNEKASKGQTNHERLFAGAPSYERIKDKAHLFYLFKYFYDNPAYLRNENQFVPFSCFDMWEKGYYKPYSEKAYIVLFDKKLSEITDMCRTLTKEQFLQESKSLFKDELC